MRRELCDKGFGLYPQGLAVSADSIADENRGAELLEVAGLRKVSILALIPLRLETSSRVILRFSLSVLKNSASSFI